MRSTSRTVDPALSRAVASHAAPAIDERAHSLQLHDLLHAHGATGVLRSGAEFARASQHELVVALSRSRTPHELSHRFRRIERLFHLGHRTEHDIAPGCWRVRHVAHLGDAPTAAESLFVCGAFIGMCDRLGVVGLTARLTDGRGRSFDVWPEEGGVHLRSVVAPISWVLIWAEDAPPLIDSATPIDDQLRMLVAEQPCHGWRLADAAAALGTSQRSLQRALAARGTTAQAMFITGRVDAAAALLQRTSLPVAHVAALTGFTDASHLTRSYRRVTGLTPGRARATAG